MKTDAVAACLNAYASEATPENARRLVTASAVRGDAATRELFALYPVGPVAAELWHDRGVEQQKAHQPRQSIESLERALMLRGNDLAGQIRELESLSSRYGILGDERRSIAYEARALDVANRLADPIVLTHTRVILATDLALVGDNDGAARTLADTTKKLPDDDAYLSTALIIEGEYQRLHGRPQLARQAFLRAEALPDSDAARDAHRNLIEVALGIGDNDEAARLVETDPIRVGFGHDFFAARVSLARGQFDEALRLVDRSLANKPDDPMLPQLETLRAKVLVKLGRRGDAIVELQRAIEQLEAHIDDLGIDELKAFAERDIEYRAPYETLFTLYARDGRTRAAFEIVQHAMGRAYLDGLISSAKVNPDLSTAARDTGARVETLQAVLKSMRASAPARVSADVVTSLGNAVIWTYFVADGRLWLVAIDHGEITLDDLGENSKLRATVEAATSLAQPALASLGERLAPPARWSHISPTTIVHLVPGPLEQIPFAALLRGGRRWIEQAAFAYAPSAGVLAELRARHTNGRSIVIGDPAGDLPDARREAIETAERFHTKAAVGSSAMKTVVLGASNAELLSVATHARAEPGSIELELADGAITIADIIDKRISPRLVVLASCESAALNGDAWGALGGAFLAAGTPNVIASRWTLDDAISHQLIADFYSANGVGHPALALAVAQRHAIARDVPVAGWAALVSLGTGEQERNER